MSSGLLSFNPRNPPLDEDWGIYFSVARDAIPRNRLCDPGVCRDNGTSVRLSGAGATD